MLKSVAAQDKVLIKRYVVPGNGILKQVANNNRLIVRKFLLPPRKDRVNAQKPLCPGAELLQHVQVIAANVSNRVVSPAFKNTFNEVKEKVNSRHCRLALGSPEKVAAAKVKELWRDYVKQLAM